MTYIKSFLQNCTSENMEDITEVERTVYSRIPAKYVFSLNCLIYEANIDENKELLQGTLTVNSRPRKIGLQRLYIDIDNNDELAKLQRLFTNYKKWKHDNLIKPIGVTYIPVLASFYLLVEWNNYHSIGENDCGLLTDAETNVKIRVIIQIADATKYLVGNDLINSNTLQYLTGNCVYYDVDFNACILFYGFKIQPRKLCSLHSMTKFEPLSTIHSESHKINWNIGTMMSLVLGNKSVSLPFGDYQQVEALITDYLDCSPKNEVKFTYLTREMDRITDEYSKVAKKQTNKWRKFKLSRKCFSKKYSESPMI